MSPVLVTALERAKFFLLPLVIQTVAQKKRSSCLSRVNAIQDDSIARAGERLLISMNRSPL